MKAPQMTPATQQGKSEAAQLLAEPLAGHIENLIALADHTKYSADAKSIRAVLDALLARQAPAQEITEAQIAAWFKAKVAEAGIKGLRLGCDTSYCGFFYGSVEGGHTHFSNSIPVAIEHVRAGIKKPAMQAQEKRAAAEKLVAEAIELETL